jgi:hypothetical protein
VQLIRFLFTCVLMTLTLGAAAQTQPDVVEQLLRDSGLQEQIDILSRSAPSQVLDELSKLPSKISKAEKERIHKQVSQAFASDRLSAEITRDLTKTLLPEHAATVLKWYATKTGQIVRQADVLATQEQTQMPPEALMPLGTGLLDKASPARRQLIEALERATDATEHLLQITLTTMKATDRGLRLGMPDQPWPDEQIMERQREAQSPLLRQSIHSYALASFAVTYRSVPDRVLKEYLAFCHSPAGKHVNNEGMRAFNKAFGNAVEDMTRSMTSAKDGQKI